MPPHTMPDATGAPRPYFKSFSVLICHGVKADGALVEMSSLGSSALARA